MKVWTILAALLVTASAQAQMREERFYGYAFDLKTGKYLYAELHHHRFDGDRWLNGSIRYVAADGRDLGIKTLDFASDPHAPVYILQLVDGYAEGIGKVGANDILTYRQETATSTREEARVVRTKEPVAADSGFHSLLCDHFDTLKNGGTLDFTFVAAGKLDAFRFRALRAGDSTFESKPAMRLQAEPSTLLRWLVDPLVLLYDRDSCRLLEYQGVSNIHDPATGKPWTVRIDFFSQTPSNIPAPPKID